LLFRRVRREGGVLNVPLRRFADVDRGAVVSALVGEDDRRAVVELEVPLLLLISRGVVPNVPLFLLAGRVVGLAGVGVLVRGAVCVGVLALGAVWVGVLDLVVVCVGVLDRTAGWVGVLGRFAVCVGVLDRTAGWIGVLDRAGEGDVVVAEPKAPLFLFVWGWVPVEVEAFDWVGLAASTLD